MLPLAMLRLRCAVLLQVRQTVAEEVSVPVMLKGKQAGALHVALEFQGPTLTTFGQVGQVRWLC
jgi:hypothetical protein